MSKRHFVTVVCAICIAVFLPLNVLPEASATDGSDLLSQQIRAISIKGETFDDALGTLTSEYGIPIGIELGDEKLTPRRKIELNLPETNVKEFLDAVIAKDPRYMWKLEGEVIHVRPLTGRDPFLTTLLDTKISHFGFTEGTYRYQIFSDILKVPEIQTQLIVANVEPLAFRMGLGLPQRVGKGISFDESNVTLRELLDRIILKTDIKRWVLMHWHWGDGEYITLRS